MAFRDFWNSVYAVSPLPEDLSLDASGLRSADIWLTPQILAGFEEPDFHDLLSDDQRRELADRVREFQAVALKVDPYDSATREDVEQAGPHLRRIIEILDFDRYQDADAFRIGKRIERILGLDHRPEIAGLTFQTGPDHAGASSLRIEVTLSPEVSRDIPRFLEVARHLRRRIELVARREAPDLWPYVFFHSAKQPLESVAAS